MHIALRFLSGYRFANRIAMICELLGRSQAVRHRFLVPAFPGSNPGAPAIFFKTLYYMFKFKRDYSISYAQQLTPKLISVASINLH